MQIHLAKKRREKKILYKIKLIHFNTASVLIRLSLLFLLQALRANVKLCFDALFDSSSAEMNKLGAAKCRSDFTSKRTVGAAIYS